MPASEIDDIFAAKGNANLSTSHPGPAPSATKKNKKNSKKRKREHIPENKPAPEVTDQRPAKRKLPETVIDPSVKTSTPSSSRKPPKAARPPEPKKKPRNVDKEEEERFKDSRGTGPRRKTEEGWNVYKEDELGITDQGGDTPLCPFDCQCCF